MNNKPNIFFWVIATTALLWNLMGLFQFGIATFFLDTMADSIPENELVLMKNVPMWYLSAFGISVFTGVFGCISMLLKKKQAVLLFLVSFIAVFLSQGYWLLGTAAIELMGMQAVLMPLIVIIIAVYLYYYSKRAARHGWLI